MYNAGCTQNTTKFFYLEIAPNVTHAALHKNIPGLFFQRIPSNIESMDIS